MSGATLYLVSACGTAEEFVAAFRRYADRTGLFVPAAAPLPAGRRGRIAVTLKTGGVMIEGEAEILQSSNKPTVLQGRPGMTIKFVEPDEPSKIIISELEKARLAMKVPAPSVPARPADVPAEPRPIVPPVGGRIDAQNALAECVVIGDLSLLTETAAPKPGGGIASGPNSKFVVPTIPGAPGGRPKTPSTPEPIAPRAKTPSIPGEPTAVNVPPPPAPLVRAKAPSIPPPVAADAAKPTPIGPSKSGPTPTPIGPSKSGPTPSLKMTSIGFPAIREPALPAEKQVSPDNPLLQTQHGVGEAPKPPAKPAPSAPSVITDDEATSLGELPPKRSTDPMPTTAPPPGPPSGEHTAVGLIPEPPKPPPKPEPSKPNYKATSIGFPALRSPYETQPVGVVPPPTNPPSDGSGAFSAKGRPQQPRGKNPTTPPLTPRHPTPASPVPIVRLPMKNMSVVTDEEKTDLSSVPVEVKLPEFPAEEQPMPQVEDRLVDPHGKTEIGVTRSGGMRASEIMAAIPTEDWTMTPDASAPTVLPSLKADDADQAAPEEVESSAPPKGPPTGNWSISLDPEAGWSEPQKIATEAPPAPPPKPKTPARGNPGIAVASEKALDVVQWDEKPTGIGEAKIEIDSTLMQPLKPMPTEDEEGVASLPARPDMIPPPLAPMPPVAPSAAFPAAALMSPSTAMPVPPSPALAAETYRGPRDSAHSLPPLARDVGPSGSIGALAQPTPAKNRIFIIGAAAAVVILIGVVVVLFSGSKKKKTAAKPPEHAVVVAPADAAVAAVVTPDAAQQVAVAPPPDAAVEVAPPPSTTCKVDIASVPSAADVYLAKSKIGVTPMTTELPCGHESVLTLKKPKFLATDKAITPSANKANKLTVKLGVSMLSLKVTSTPSGATITIGGKSAGVTPTTVKVPSGVSTITLSKPGYAPDTEKVNAKANGQSHHVTLKKGGRH